MQLVETLDYQGALNAFDLGIYLAGKNQKALPAFYVVGLCNALCIIGHQSAGAGQYIVE